MHPAQPSSRWTAQGARKALGGFFVSGLLLSFPGAILPAWGYHLRPSYATIGHYFLSVNLGLLVSVRLAHSLVASRGAGSVAAIGCAIAFIALLGLSFTMPPVAQLWRLPGFFGLGVGSGLLNTALFYGISPAYRQDPAATVNLAGVFFGLGSLAVTLMIAGTFNVYTGSSILFLIAMVPGFFTISFARNDLPFEVLSRPRSWREVARELTALSAVLFSLLLFFHFGNEWSIAGWLPLFLIQRLGLSPAASLLVLATYWLALLVGRLAVQSVLPRFPHGKLLLGAVIASLLGCLMLTFAVNLFGALLAVLFVGVGFAPVYPLVVEKIGARFPHYHPGFFNGIFSFALTGGMLAPATLGYAGEFMGVGIVTIVPAIGTFIVLLLVLAIWQEAKLVDASPKPDRRNTRSISRQ